MKSKKKKKTHMLIASNYRNSCDYSMRSAWHKETRENLKIYYHIGKNGTCSDIWILVWKIYRVSFSLSIHISYFLCHFLLILKLFGSYICKLPWVNWILFGFFFLAFLWYIKEHFFYIELKGRRKKTDMFIFSISNMTESLFIKPWGKYEWQPGDLVKHRDFSF